jgi:hypothetical protein
VVRSSTSTYNSFSFCLSLLQFSPPLRYLALKFQEMEEKMRREKSKGKVTTQPTTSSEENDEPAEQVPDIPEKLAPSEQQHYSTTEMSRPPPPISLPPVPYTAIETEKVEVIEIKAAGNSGHLTPNHNPDYDDRL